MSEHRRDSDRESWIEKNGLSLLAIVGTVTATIITASMFFGKTVNKVDAYETRICKVEKSCEEIPTLNGKLDVVLALLDPQGEKRKRIRH